MKKLLLVFGIGLFGVAGVNAQTEAPEIPDGQVKEKKYDYEKEKDGYTLETKTVYEGEEGFVKEKRDIEYSTSGEPKSMVGGAISTVGNGAKAAGKGIGKGAKAVGKGAKNAGSWTWDKIKHNKLTKNLFNQDEGASASANPQQLETEVESEIQFEDAESEAQHNIEGAEGEVQVGVESEQEIEDAGAEAKEEIQEIEGEAKGELEETEMELQDTEKETEIEIEGTEEKAKDKC